MSSTDGVQIGVLLKVLLGVLQFARRLRGNPVLCIVHWRKVLRDLTP